MTKQRLYRQMFAAFILIVLFYNLIASGVLYYKNNEIFDIRMKSNQKFFLELSAEKIDSHLSVANGLYNQLLVNEYISGYIHDVEMNYYHITRSSRVIASYTDPFYNHGYRVDMFKLSHNLVITPVVTMDNERYFQSIGLTEEQRQEVLALATDESNSSEVLIIPKREADERDYAFTLVRKEKRGIAEAALILISFSESFMPELTSEHEAFVIMHNGRIVNSVAGSKLPHFADQLGVQWQQAVEEAKRESTYGLQGYHSMKMEDYTIHSIGGQTGPEWQYVYITDRGETGVSWTTHLIEATVALLVLGVVGIGMALLLTRRTYRPIRQIAATMKGEHDGDEKDDLIYIQETTTRIAAANEKLRNAIQQSQMPLKKKFMRDLVYGLVPEQSIDGELEQHGLELLAHPSTIVILECTNTEQMEDHFSKDAMLHIIVQTVRVIEELVKQEVACELFELEYNRYAVLAAEHRKDKLRKLINSTLTRIEAEYEISFIAAIGDGAASAGELERSFRSALRLLEYRFFVDNRMVISSEDISDVQDINFYYPLDDERDLVNSVMTGKREQALSILEELLVVNLQERHLNPDVLSKFIFALASTINRVLQQFTPGDRNKFAEAENVYGHLMTWETSEQLRERVLSVFTSLMEIRQLESEKSDNQIAYSMIQFISENYSRDISLSDIADHFQITPGYVSTLFKKYTGENFKNHLNIYRVQRAKEIAAEQPNIKIVELAAMVGCNNVDTFIRIFKKYEGVSPGQYVKDQHKP